MTSATPSNNYVVAFGTSSTAALIPHIDKRDPTLYDTTPKYVQGQFWVNELTNAAFQLMSFSSTSGQVLANWIQIGNIAGSPLNTLTGDVGAAIAPSGNNINIQGGASGAIIFSNGGLGQMNAAVQVDNSTITIVADQLTAANTVVVTGSTTNIAPYSTSIYSVAIPDNTTFYFEADFIGTDAAHAIIAGGKQQAVVKKVAGAVSIIDIENQWIGTAPTSPPSGQQDAQFQPNVPAGPNLDFVVFGSAAGAMNWKARINFVSVA